MLECDRYCPSAEGEERSIDQIKVFWIDVCVVELGEPGESAWFGWAKRRGERVVQQLASTRMQLTSSKSHQIDVIYLDQFRIAGEARARCVRAASGEVPPPSLVSLLCEPPPRPGGDLAGGAIASTCSYDRVISLLLFAHTGHRKFLAGRCSWPRATPSLVKLLTEQPYLLRASWAAYCFRKPDHSGTPGG